MSFLDNEIDRGMNGDPNETETPLVRGALAMKRA